MIQELRASLIDMRSDANPEVIIGDIIRKYSEPRPYHNWHHVLHCYNEYIENKGLFRRPSIGLVTLLYHDIVYNPKRNDNELQSALYAYQQIEKHADPAIAALISDGILATKHNAIPYDTDTKLILDIDLSILGQDWERFQEYDAQIRQEYSFVADEQYATARINVLENFLNRPTIYLSDYFRTKYEMHASKNLEKKIFMLKNHIS